MADIKRAFYAIQRHLRGMREHVADVALGPACEGWLNAEAFAALCRVGPPALRPDEYAMGESKKRDLLIRTGKRISHVVEVKVLYPRQDGPLGYQLQDLRRQVDRTSYGDEADGVRRIGIVYGIWTTYYQRRETPAEFFGRAQRLLTTEFPFHTYTTQRDYRFEPCFRAVRVQLPHATHDVHVRSTYVTLRR